MQEAMRLRDSGHTVEKLTDRLADMKAKIRDWEDEFDVESPEPAPWDARRPNP
jgi:hypothetical protein